MVILALVILAVLSTLPAYAEQPVLISEGTTKSVEVGKQIQIAADLRNNQDMEQDFAYIVQIQNDDGVTISLSWLTGTLTPAQTFSPAVSWIPDEAGKYEATIFVWESIANPTALSPTLSLNIVVGQSV